MDTDPARQNDVQRTLRIVCTPLNTLRILLAQWKSMQIVQVDTNQSMTKVVADLTTRISSQGNITRADLNQLELLHLKINADEESWHAYRYTDKIPKKNIGNMKWASREYYVNSTEARGASWYRLERKSNGIRNYIIADWIKQKVIFRGGAKQNSQRTNEDFCRGFNLSCLNDVIEAQIETNREDDASSVLDNQSLLSVNLSRIMTNTTIGSTSTFNDTVTPAANTAIISQSVLKKSNQVLLKVPSLNPNNKKQPVQIVFSSLDGENLYETLANACGGSENINPGLLKKRPTNKRKQTPRKNTLSEVTLKENELLELAQH